MKLILSMVALESYRKLISHRVIIKNITLLVFYYSNYVYISNLTKKIKLSELEEYLKKLESH